MDDKAGNTFYRSIYRLRSCNEYDIKKNHVVILEFFSLINEGRDELLNLNDLPLFPYTALLLVRQEAYRNKEAGHDTVCTRCGKNGTIPCGGCSDEPVYYCSQACMEQDSLLHSIFCKSDKHKNRCACLSCLSSIIITIMREIKGKRQKKLRKIFTSCFRNG